MSKDVNSIMQAYWEMTDALLFGRKTWDMTQTMGGGPSTAGMKSYLFSRTLATSPDPTVELVRGDAGEFVRSLKREKGKNMLVMSGGDLARSLFAAGVVDEVGLNVHPVLLGAGAPMFRDPGERVGLQLVESRVLDGGCVLMNYQVRSR